MQFLTSAPNFKGLGWLTDGGFKGGGTVGAAALYWLRFFFQKAAFFPYKKA